LLIITVHAKHVVDSAAKRVTSLFIKPQLTIARLRLHASQCSFISISNEQY